MKAEQLRKSILQLAIQGKLVPQDPNDEPASVLLERIRAEKQQLIKEGKIKKDKNDSFIFKGADNRHYEKIGLEVKDITDDLPFEIPDSWVWTRIQSYVERVTDFVASGSFATLRENVKYYKAENYALLVKTQDFSNNFTKDLTYTDKHGYEFLSNSNIFGGELILSNVGSIGKIFITPNLNRPATLAPNAIMVRCIDKNHIMWLYDFFRSEYGLMNLLSISSATAIKKFNKTDFKNIIIPIPPLAEQARIVAEIEKFEPLIAEYDKLEQQATKLDDEIYDKLKKSILQYAIQGKLVPQDPNDEPASVLLERIRAEKKAKLGKKYVDSCIYKGDDNCYYEHMENEDVNISDILPLDIPDTWSWVKIGDIAFVTKLAGFEYTKYVAPNLQVVGVPLFKGKNIQNSKINYTFESYIPLSISNELQRSQISKKCILTPYVGTIGNIGIHDKDGIYHLGSNVGKIELETDKITTEEYVILYLKSSYGYAELTKYKKATAQESISIEAIREVYLPLPPLSEQKRIVAKINEIFAML